MRIAILADIHGNDLALQAVINDIEGAGGVDRFWVLGDLVAIGPNPIQVLERLQSLSNVRFVRGNTDRYVCTGERPGPTVDQVLANPALMKQLLEVEGDFSWTQGAVTAAGWYDWLSGLPLEFREKLPNGTSVLGVHASPKKDDGSGIHPNLSEAEVEFLIADCQEELICVGHTHQAFDLRTKNKRVINPGSVSNPVGADVRASYAILNADQSGYEVDFCRTAYNQQIIIDWLEKHKHPARRFITQHLRGERLPLY